MAAIDNRTPGLTPVLDSGDDTDLARHCTEIEDLVASQAAEIARLQAQLKQATTTGRQAGQTGPPAAPPGNGPPGNILVVDDTPANLHLLIEILSQRGHRVRAVLYPHQALTAALASPPDMILLDIMMPEMDGIEVCHHLKADDRTRDIPILFISALDDTAGKVQALAAGGVDYITKPFHVQEVLARVQVHLTLRHLQRQIQAANDKLSCQVEELRAHNEELDAFARTVAHDIKNPLSVIVGGTNLLALDYDVLPEEERRATLATMEKKAMDLARVVDGLLLLARVRQAEVPWETLAMEPILARVLDRLEGTITRAQAELVLPPAQTWPLAWGYGPWVEEMWANYISNACHYAGPAPRIEIGFCPLAAVPHPGPDHSLADCQDPELRTVPDREGSMIKFWVRDHGPGIAPRDQARLFTPFTQLSHGLHDGHGLGLSIVQRIASRLGGQVGVESEGLPGKGSLFYFTLPGGTGIGKQGNWELDEVARTLE